jgi:Phosphopantetheine attachment site.
MIMTLEEFIEKVQDELQDTPADQITAETNYKELDEWGSLASLSLISMIEEAYDKLITGADVRACNSVKELYEFVESL